MTYKAGDRFEATFPFVRTTYTEHDAEGESEVRSWKPGVEYEMVGYEGHTEAIAHGEGRVVLSVVDVHKPGKYPARVFFTRQWVRPDGRLFGKTKLRITTVPAFRRLTLGWRHEEYEVCDTPATAENECESAAPPAGFKKTDEPDEQKRSSS